MDQTSTNLETPPSPPPVQAEMPPPVWLQRVFMITYCLFCMVIGMALVTLPWAPNWFERGLVARWPALQAVLQSGFVKGAITGLGIIDIWIGVQEAIHYHDRR